jgi:hypothetical protein
MVRVEQEILTYEELTALPDSFEIWRVGPRQSRYERK